MECPTTGRVCLYRTHLNKINELCLVQRALAEDDNTEELYGTLSNAFTGAVEKAEVSPCDEDYCSALSNAVVDALIFRGLTEHKLRNGNVPKRVEE